MLLSIGEYIYKVDKMLFNWIQETYHGPWLGDYLVFSGNLYFWMPLWVFLAVILYQAYPKRASYHLPFAMMAFVLAYQCSAILNVFIPSPPPFVLAKDLGITMPAYHEGWTYSLPDWAMASFIAILAFSARVIRRSGASFPMLLYVTAFIFALSRIIAGFAFPIDIVFGLLVGNLIGFLVDLLLQNLMVVLKIEE